MIEPLNLDELATIAERYRLHETHVHRQSSYPPYQVQHNGGHWHLVSIGGTIADETIGRIYDLEPGDADNLQMLLKALPLLIDELQIIRTIAEPFRYAIRERVDPDRHDDDTVFVNTALWDEDGLSITAGHLKKLLYAIYDDYPDLKIPPYNDEPA